MSLADGEKVILWLTSQSEVTSVLVYTCSVGRVRKVYGSRQMCRNLELRALRIEF